jgi:hypothetical protein
MQMMPKRAAHGLAPQRVDHLAPAEAHVQPIDAATAEDGRFAALMRDLLTETPESRKQRAAVRAGPAIADGCTWCGSPVMLAFAAVINEGGQRSRYHESCLFWSTSMREPV